MVAVFSRTATASSATGCHIHVFALLTFSIRTCLINNAASCHVATQQWALTAILPPQSRGSVVVALARRRRRRREATVVGRSVGREGGGPPRRRRRANYATFEGLLKQIHGNKSGSISTQRQRVSSAHREHLFLLQSIETYYED